MEWEFTAQAIEWRGPAPFVFLPLPPEAAAEIKAVSAMVTYGWGVIPVSARIGGTEFTTALFPKDSGYLLPVKVAVQQAEGVQPGDMATARIAVSLESGRSGPDRL